MKKILCLLILLLTTHLYSQKTVTVEDVVLPVTFKLKLDDLKTKLVLNGFGVRTKFFISLYVEGLYLKEISTDGKAILDSRDPMMVRLHLTSSLVTNKKIIEAINNGIRKTYVGDIAPIQIKMDEMIAFFKDELKPEDNIDLIYDPNIDSIIVSLNDKVLGKVQGFDFKRAVFGIWLEEKPINKTLKSRLLGL